MKTQQFKKWTEVPKKYRWDLEAILEGKTLDFWIKKSINNIKNFIKTKDSKYDSSENYLTFLKKMDKHEEIQNKISNYISNSISQNIVDEKIQAISQEYEFQNYNLSLQLGSESARFFANAKKITKWIELPSFKKYAKDLKIMLSEKKHQLPKAIKEFRIIESRADIAVEKMFSILTNTEMQFKDAVSSKGKKIPVNITNSYKLSKHSDFNVRKTAKISMENAFLNHKASLSNMLFEHFKKIVTWSKLKKHDDVISYLLYGDRADEKLITTIYSAVESNKGIFKKFNTFHKKFYKAKFNKNMTKYDRNIELVKVNSSFSIDETQEIVLEAVKPFGEEYHSTVKKAIDENWIDYMQVENKRSGAYSIGGTYGIEKKYILMNFDGTLNSVSTLAHELGHSMHSFLSDNNNDINNSQYPIFLAEIASIFNELMISDYLLNKKDVDDKAKFSLLQYNINLFSSTVMRQILFSNYEYDVYKAVEAGKPVSTYDALSKIYFENVKKYSNKKNIKYNANEMIASIYVPHYYYGFYVYKYAVGQLVANIFFQKYKTEGKEALENYLNDFLAKSGRDFPLEVLKNAGIDLYDSSVYELGFKAVEANINEWVKLGKKIFKI